MFIFFLRNKKKKNRIIKIILKKLRNCWLTISICIPCPLYFFLEEEEEEEAVIVTDWKKQEKIPTKNWTLRFCVAVMEEMYGVPSTVEYADKSLMTPENLIFAADYHSFLMSTSSANRIPMFGSDDIFSAEPSSAAIQDDVASSVMKAKIASHPYYPRLLQAYIDCQKVIVIKLVSYNRNRFSETVIIFWITNFCYEWIVGWCSSWNRAFVRGNQ